MGEVGPRLSKPDPAPVSTEDRHGGPGPTEAPRESRFFYTGRATVFERQEPLGATRALTGPVRHVTATLSHI